MGRGNLTREIPALVRQAKGHYEQLILVVGPAGSGKTKALRGIEQSAGYPYLSLGLELSQRLREVPVRQRPFRVSQYVDAIVADCGSDVVLLDNLE